MIALFAGFFDFIATPNGFGWLQIAGLVVGIALIGAGIARALSETRGPPRNFEADDPTNDETSDPMGGLPPWP